jgi:hypothetical protein
MLVSPSSKEKLSKVGTAQYWLYETEISILVSQIARAHCTRKY